MLVATFAISFLLQNIALLKFGARGKPVGTLTGLNSPIANGTLIVRWVCDRRDRGGRGRCSPASSSC